MDGLGFIFSFIFSFLRKYKKYSVHVKKIGYILKYNKYLSMFTYKL